MTRDQLRRKIVKLARATPRTATFETAAGAVRGVVDRWHGRQKEHWLRWLADYNGPGHYDRATWEGVSAEQVYNRAVNPSLLVWLAEASGVPRNTLDDGIRAALGAGKTMMAQSGAFRRVVPWEMVEKGLR